MAITTTINILGQSAPLLLNGLLTTVSVFLLAATLGFGVGIVLALLRHEALPKGLSWIKPLVIGYIELQRSIPLLLFLVFMHYGIMPLFIERPPFFLSSVLALGFFESAYFAEIIRGGLRGTLTTERDAAESIGLNQVQQWWLILLPLALYRSTPALINQAVTLMKDTSLTAVVGLIEWNRAGEIIYEQHHNEVEILAVQAFVYFILCYGLTLLGKRIEKTSPLAHTH